MMNINQTSNEKPSTISWVCIHCGAKNETLFLEGQTSTVCDYCARTCFFDSEFPTNLEKPAHHAESNIDENQHTSLPNTKAVKEIELRKSWLGMGPYELVYKCPKCDERIESNSALLDSFDNCPDCNERFKLTLPP